MNKTVPPRRPTPGQVALTSEPRQRQLPPARRVEGDLRDELGGALERGSLARVRKSVYVPRLPANSPADQRAVEVLALMRGVAERLTTTWWFSHSSAALLWGCWTWHLQPEVHVTQLSNPHIRKNADPTLERHWTNLPERDRSEIAGVPVTALERTAVDCARELREPGALVVADSALRLGADPGVMQEILRESAGKRGVRRARLVIGLADGRSESPGESLVRWIAHDYGLPPTELAIPVTTALGEFFIDLGWPDLKIGIEFDGAVKYSGDEYGDPIEVLAAQRRRQAALEAEGWTILRVTWDELEDSHLLALRLLKALHSAGWRQSPAR